MTNDYIKTDSTSVAVLAVMKVEVYYRYRISKCGIVGSKLRCLMGVKWILIFLSILNIIFQVNSCLGCCCFSLKWKKVYGLDKSLIFTMLVAALSTIMSLHFLKGKFSVSVFLRYAYLFVSILLSFLNEMCECMKIQRKKTSFHLAFKNTRLFQVFHLLFYIYAPGKSSWILR